MGDVVSHFIMPLKVHFKVPEQAEDDPMAFFEDMRGDLARFDNDTLRKAASQIRQTRDNTVIFPSVAECISTCKDILGSEASKRPLNGPQLQGLGRDYQSKRADRMICCDIGQRAAKEGWISRLWDYCREQDCLPSDDEISKMVAAHKILEKDFDDLCRLDKVLPCVLTARKAILAKRSNLSALVMRNEH